jgi:hypothetical protein
LTRSTVVVREEGASWYILQPAKLAGDVTCNRLENGVNS